MSLPPSTIFNQTTSFLSAGPPGIVQSTTMQPFASHPGTGFGITANEPVPIPSKSVPIANQSEPGHGAVCETTGSDINDGSSASTTPVSDTTTTDTDNSVGILTNTSETVSIEHEEGTNHATN